MNERGQTEERIAEVRSSLKKLAARLEETGKTDYRPVDKTKPKTKAKTKAKTKTKKRSTKKKTSKSK